MFPSQRFRPGCPSSGSGGHGVILMRIDDTAARVPEDGAVIVAAG
jgi:hypothetical protein